MNPDPLSNSFCLFYVQQIKPCQEFLLILITLSVYQHVNFLLMTFVCFFFFKIFFFWPFYDHPLSYTVSSLSSFHPSTILVPKPIFLDYFVWFLLSVDTSRFFFSLFNMISPLNSPGLFLL